MPKKNDVAKMKENLARLNERSKSAEEELKRLEEKRKKVQNLIAEEERKKRTHNLCSVGGLVYKYFGDDISPEEFKGMLDFLLTRCRILFQRKRRSVFFVIIRLS